MKANRGIPIIHALIAVALLAACGGGTTSLSDSLPDMADAPDWQATGEARTYDEETLYDLVNGQADAYFAYGFEQVAVQSYAGPEGRTVDVEIWQVATPADAYGLHTANRTGQPVEIGNGGDADPGRRLAFWQARYYVRVFARQPVTPETLRGFAEATALALPTGGERPALVDRLPEEGLVPGSVLFFHRPISIQDRVWLGDENVLGLDQETEGVLGRYEIRGSTAELMVVRYPSAEEAAAKLEAVRNSGLDTLIIVDARDALLAAAFGDVDRNAIVAHVGLTLGKH